MQTYICKELPDGDPIKLKDETAQEVAKQFVENWLISETSKSYGSFNISVIDQGEFEHIFNVEVEHDQVESINHQDQEEMDDRVYLILRQMEDSGQSETAGVADILKTIAENGDGQAVTSYLIGCAEEIIAAAQAFIADAKPYT